MCDGEAMWTDNQFTELEGLNGIGNLQQNPSAKFASFTRATVAKM
jgi:hypothetical protein